MTRMGAIRMMLVIWGIGAGVLSLIVFVQSALGKYGPDARMALSWLLTGVAPTLSLVCTAAFADSSKRWREGLADKFRYRMAAAGSIAYLLALVGLLFLEPFVELTAFQLFELSELPLAVWQALAVAAITAVIFDKR